VLFLWGSNIVKFGIQHWVVRHSVIYAEFGIPTFGIGSFGIQLFGIQTYIVPILQVSNTIWTVTLHFNPAWQMRLKLTLDRKKTFYLTLCVETQMCKLKVSLRIHFFENEVP
jgi:hypothetical protein